ncbi:MAG: septum formation inhibitor Maf [Pseudomonadales bacterium]|nr:septum formation inhibitor Maf [Pseudomonadales bacterium]
MFKLILASGSPRRASLLQQINLGFDIIRPDIDESVQSGESPVDYVARMSEGKLASALEMTGPVPQTLVLCADTIVELDGEILLKPESEAHATDMLMRMSGRTHLVWTSVSLGDAQRRRRETFLVDTQVTFREITSDECRAYWATGEPADKSGSYGIQGIGAIFVASIQGSSSNVAGLPLMETARWLREFGIDCLAMASGN